MNTLKITIKILKYNRSPHDTSKVIFKVGLHCFDVIFGCFHGYTFSNCCCLTLFKMLFVIHHFEWPIGKSSQIVIWVVT
jgi:hypothetical protein